MDLVLLACEDEGAKATTKVRGEQKEQKQRLKSGRTEGTNAMTKIRGEQKEQKQRLKFVANRRNNSND